MVRGVLCLSVLAVLLGTACSDVRVLKVPSPTQYDHWDDERQRCADSMEGFRFYMQRPFIVVNEPFPLTSKSYIVDGYVSPDRGHVVVTAPQGETLGGVLKTCRYCTATTAGSPQSAAEKYSFPYSALRLRGGSPQSAREGAGAPQSTGEGTQLVMPEGEGSLGITEIGARVTNEPYPTTLLRRYIDIVNLPDFDEQFAVRRIQGLGSVSSELTTGQGNILQGFNARVNNEDLSRLAYGMIHAGAQALTSKGINALGLPALPAGSTGIVPGDSPDSGKPESVSEKLGNLRYEPISLVISVIYYATPGVYPIMKPREVVDWQRVGAFQTGYGGCYACPTADGGLAMKLGPYGIPYKTFQYVLIEQASGRGPTAHSVITADPPAEQGPTTSKSDMVSKIKTG